MEQEIISKYVELLAQATHQVVTLRVELEQLRASMGTQDQPPVD